jgi:hypothetical protein
MDFNIMSRPRKDPKEALSRQLSVLLTEEEGDAVEAVAKLDCIAPSQCGRQGIRALLVQRGAIPNPIDELRRQRAEKQPA